MKNLLLLTLPALLAVACAHQPMNQNVVGENAKPYVQNRSTASAKAEPISGLENALDGEGPISTCTISAGGNAGDARPRTIALAKDAGFRPKFRNLEGYIGVQNSALQQMQLMATGQDVVMSHIVGDEIKRHKGGILMLQDMTTLNWMTIDCSTDN
ncbi:MAG: hypothetical protein ACXVLQ_10410 [Bacteriovorax sp.]